MPSRMDNLIAKGRGAVRSVEAHLGGLRGVFRTLAQQHGEVAALLKRVKHHPDKRRELWPTIRMELLSHERAETRELYPVLRQRQATQALADRHDFQVVQMEERIEALQRLDIDSDAWGKLFAELADSVMAHAHEEEQSIFPAAQATLGADYAEELTKKVLRAKRQIAESL
jgi:hemerythrin superfamily protein